MACNFAAKLSISNDFTKFFHFLHFRSYVSGEIVSSLGNMFLATSSLLCWNDNIDKGK